MIMTPPASGTKAEAPPTRRGDASRTHTWLRLRVGLVLIVVLTAGLIVSLLGSRGHVTTVLVAELPSNVSNFKNIENMADKEGVDRIVFVNTGGAVQSDDVQGLIRKSPLAEEVTSKSTGEVIDAMPPQVHVLAGKESQPGSSAWQPNWLAVTLSLALLAIGVMLARAVFAPSSRAARVPGAAAPAPRAQPDGPGWLPPYPDVGRDSGSPRASPRQDAATPVRREIDLRSFHTPRAQSDWTPQCPHCGAFRPQQTRTDGAGAHYACQHCGETWHVVTGDPWPTVIVRPRHRRVG